MRDICGAERCSGAEKAMRASERPSQTWSKGVRRRKSGKEGRSYLHILNCTRPGLIDVLPCADIYTGDSQIQDHTNERHATISSSKKTQRTSQKFNRRIRQRHRAIRERVWARVPFAHFRQRAGFYELDAESV